LETVNEQLSAGVVFKIKATLLVAVTASEKAIAKWIVWATLYDPALLVEEMLVMVGAMVSATVTVNESVAVAKPSLTAH
jgi:hypothetical protein